MRSGEQIVDEEAELEEAELALGPGLLEQALLARRHERAIVSRSNGEAAMLMQVTLPADARNWPLRRVPEDLRRRYRKGGFWNDETLGTFVHARTGELAGFRSGSGRARGRSRTTSPASTGAR